MTIKIKIEPRKGDGLYEIHVGGEGEKFLVSHQGYENAGDAESLVRRLFGSPERPELGDRPEPVDLTVQNRDGKGKHEMIR